MKKTIALLLVLVLAFGQLVGCGSSTVETAVGTTPATEETSSAPETAAQMPNAGTTIRLGGLKGPTSMGLVKLLSDGEEGQTENSYEFTMAASADELTPLLLRGELDVLAVPANLGAILYNNSDGAVQMAAINTLGVLYIAEKGGEEIQSLADLKGRTLYATGKGTTPEYTLRYLLSQAGLSLDEDLTVEWRSEPTEVVAQLAASTHAAAMLPQPFVTVAQTQLEDLRIALDLNAEWESLDNGSALVTACLLVRKAFAEEHPEQLAAFLEEYAASAQYVNKNPEEAAVLVERYDIVKAAVAQKAIPYCNIVCVTGSQMRTMAEGYLAVLYQQNPASVGGAMPGEDFYLNNEA